VIALIGASHWDVVATGSFPAPGKVAVGEAVAEGPAGGTLNATSLLLSRRPLLITQRPRVLDSRHAEMLTQVELAAVEVERLSTATIVVDEAGDRSIFLGKRPTPWPPPPPALAAASVIDWHWTAPARLLREYAPLMRGRVVTAIRAVDVLLENGITPWAVVDSVADAEPPNADWLARCGCTWCVMTDGARGGSYWSDGRWASYGADATEVIETTGCGDAFRAGLLAAIDDQLEAPEAVRQGASWAASAARHRGANRFVSELADLEFEGVPVTRSTGGQSGAQAEREEGLHAAKPS
jgi:sugar/nucleoside kinase (ribokinase family)